MRAWLMEDVEGRDPREELRKGEGEVDAKELEERLGVHSWHLQGLEEDKQLGEIREKFGMSYSDVVTVSRETLADYDAKLAMFFEEHMHDDDEIRFLLDGSGYFDVRSASDQWIRIQLQAGDMISLPAGIYHRFTVDQANYAKAMRLFVGEPVWVAHPRPADQRPARVQYVAKHLQA